MQDLLKELEEFAFRGIPDMRPYSNEDIVTHEEMVRKIIFVANMKQVKYLIIANVVRSQYIITLPVGAVKKYCNEHVCLCLYRCKRDH